MEVCTLMFRVENNVPEVYVRESRDFQLFSRLYDLVFQSSRFSIDSLESVSDTMRCNDTLLPLIAKKVGFFTDLKLTSNADRQILSAFPYIINYKGSLKGIELVANVFERIMNTKVTVETDEEDSSRVTIVFDSYAPDVSLLYSLLDYIRPTGLVIDYRIQNKLKFDVDYETYDQVSIRKTSVVDTSEDYASGVVVSVDSTNKNNPDIASNIGFTEIVQVDNTTEEI